jgi:hydroxyacylglutathione hydrolase
MDTERYEVILSKENLNVIALIDSHIHADHISGIRLFSQLYPNSEMSVFENAPVEFQCRRLHDGEVLDYDLGSNFSIDVMHTPGHTLDHICLLLSMNKGYRGRQFLMSGDCLFIGDVGRTDLGRGDNDKMYDSLFHKILKLDPRTEVYPAHIGRKHFLPAGKVRTTIGVEKKTNPALQIKSKEEFIRYMTEGWPPRPEYYQEIININLGKSSLLEVQEQIRKSQGESYQHARID